ncbi:MAG: DUF4838 domain-containing protein, partial [Kiritimatiellaeota bacterium]|nr:DUF4838 domain-containing protein [Kiritimatiellota bacterium]
QQPEEILLAANGEHLVITGRDRWDPQHLTAISKTGKAVIKQQESGTANAVYTFLQDKLDVRWLWPGELGVDLVKRPDIRIAPFEYRYHPVIRSRGGVFQFSALMNTRGYGRAHEWTRLQRLQLHSLDMEGGHGFSDWWGRYHTNHPDIFALQPDGTRSGFPDPRTAKLCEANPKVGELWLKGVEEQLLKDPTRTVFNGSPNDSWMSGYCTCQDCRARDPADGEPRLFIWKGHREERPALSDREVIFANQLGALLRQRYPGKQYYVLMLSYGHSRPAPLVARPADNVLISSVANCFSLFDDVDRGSTRGNMYRQQLADWAKVVPQLLWRPNTGGPGGWQQGLPDIQMTQLARTFRFIADHKCIGIYIDSTWEHWATQGPQYYLMAQLAWNPRQDDQAIMDDYYRRAFGPAALPIKNYFQILEQARMAYVEKHNTDEAGVLGLPHLYTDDLQKRAEAALQLAGEKAAGAAPCYQQRVQFVGAGLTWTRLVTENIRLMGQYWRKQDDALAAKVRANWTAMERLCAEHPGAINWGPCRPGTDRMLGLHPDYPNPKWKKKTLNAIDDL